MTKKINFKKNFFWNSIGSTVNACMSLFLMILVTRINGTNQAGIFTFSFSFACLLQVIGMYAGRAYQVTERDKKTTDTDFIMNKVLTCVFMLIACFAYLFLEDYSSDKNIIILLLVLYKLLEAFVDVFYGIIQKNGALYQVGISLFLRGVFSTIAFAVVDLLTHNLFLAIGSMLLVSVVILLFYDITNLKQFYKREKVNWKNSFSILRLGVWVFFITLLTQYIMNAPKYAIDDYLSNDLQTIFGIIVMPATVIALVSQFIIHPLLNKLTAYLNENNLKQFHKTIFKILFYVFGFGILAIVVAYFIGIPFLEFVYGLKLTEYRLDLIIIIGGATLYGMAYVISNALTSLRDTFSQVVIFGTSSIFAFFLSKHLVFTQGIHGASYAYVLSMCLLFVLYIIYYFIKKGKTKNG